MNRQSQTYPVYPANSSGSKQWPSWPAVSIVLLVIIAAIFPPGLLTGMNLYLLLLALIVWLNSREPFDQDLLRVISPFFLIIAIGLAVGVGAERYLYLKDAWYVSNPAVIISVGYVLFRCMPDLPQGLRAFVLGGTLLALLHLTKFAINPELLSLSAGALRSEAGTGYYAPALAVMILFAYRGSWTEGLKLPRWAALHCFLICSLAVLASFSRTMLIVVLIGGLASLGVFARREWLRIGVSFAIVLLVLAILRGSLDVDSNETSKSFLGKLARTTEELTVNEYSDLKSINLNWRGYETARALNYYSSGRPQELLFGYGFGAQLDIGLFMPLGSGPNGERTPVRLVPILHNGYAYLLVKGGVSALALFGYTLFCLYRLGRRGAVSLVRDFSTQSSRLLQAVAITLSFTTWVIAGVFNKLDMFPFLMLAGVLLAALTRKVEAPT
jgi:hypothetical protein